MKKFDGEEVLYTEDNPKEIFDKWQRKFKQNLDFQLNGLKKGPYESHGFYINENPQVILEEYMNFLKEKLVEKFKIKSDLSGSNFYEWCLSNKKLREELKPLIFLGKEVETYLILPRPEIPEDFLIEYISKQNSKLGIIGPQTSSEISLDKTPKNALTSNKVPKLKIPKEKSTYSSVKILSLKELFQKDFGGLTEYVKMKKFLYKQSLLTEDLKCWIGKGDMGKIHLANTIKFIGIYFFKMKFSEKQIEKIAQDDFNLKISTGAVKKAKSEFGEITFKDYTLYTKV
ncbi:hypothetical protein ACFPIK_08840 [Algoriphagus aquatilis]|uniref:Uncharacterized protein n=1 Tax=Algoriphagus aquatilis TaxID=490186 RepID=A0ABW0BVS2_9BACT